MSLLEVKNLQVCFHTRKGIVRAVEGAAFSLDAGKTLALVGESGSGKSVSAMSVLRLLDGNGFIDKGEILFSCDGKQLDLVKVPMEQMYSIRGDRISVIFQEPMTSLNPTQRVGMQVEEVLKLHTKMRKEERKAKVLETFASVGLKDAERVYRSYPHQLSGGMSQRVMIAMAMSNDPKLLIADEPTTALDVTIQAQILDLMKKIQKEENSSILLITHDLGVVAEMCSRVIVMYAGKIVEEAPVEVLFGNPSHPYTQGLIASVPKLGSGVKVLPSIPGSVPDLASMPEGCRFAPRCKYATDKCRKMNPDLFQIGENHRCRCWLMDK